MILYIVFCLYWPSVHIRPTRYGNQIVNMKFLVSAKNIQCIKKQNIFIWFLRDITLNKNSLLFIGDPLYLCQDSLRALSSLAIHYRHCCSIIVPRIRSIQRLLRWKWRWVCSSVYHFTSPKHIFWNQCNFSSAHHAFISHRAKWIRICIWRLRRTTCGCTSS